MHHAGHEPFCIRHRCIGREQALDGNGGPRRPPLTVLVGVQSAVRRDSRSNPRSPTAPFPASSTSTPTDRTAEALPTRSPQAAARAGLKFVVFTDHGDATRSPDPPTYRSGVLCLDAVEISTEGGHYLALDMPAAPYPLGGDARGVVEDVKRLGGFGVVAHPNSPKSDLSWDDWDAPFDAIEWLNPDTSWRLKVASARMAVALEHRRRAGGLSVPVARNHRAPPGRHGARRRPMGVVRAPAAGRAARRRRCARAAGADIQ